MPVGEDQRQHLELTRNLAQRFNARYGETFVVPERLHPQGGREDPRPAGPDRQDEQVAAATPAPSNLLDDPSALAKKIKRAVTDTGTEIRFDPETKPGVSNLLVDPVRGDRAARSSVAESSSPGRATARSRRPWPTPWSRSPSRSPSATAELLADPAELDRMLARGAERASRSPSRRCATAYERVGFVRPAE